MKIAASNIGWQVNEDKEAWEFLQEHGFQGLEVAPGRVVPKQPYEHTRKAEAFAKRMVADYGLAIVSMQSIWFGRSENIFRSEDERVILIKVTKQAVDFAAAMHCPNLVFGCPRQRNMEQAGQDEVAKEFFRKIGDYAVAHGTVIALEANPPIYNTNLLNRTEDVLAWAEELKHPGLTVNLDVGTMVENQESAEMLRQSLQRVTHVHVSEPYLAPVESCSLHQDLKRELQSADYQGFVSLEMKAGAFAAWQQSAAYLAEVFGA